MSQQILDFDRARRRGGAGMASSLDHANDEALGWSGRAYGFLCRYVAAEPAPFTIEQFRAWAVRAGLDRPAEERAYGAVAQRALRQGLVVKVGYAPTASSNGSVKALYARPAGEVAA